jgi:hypothetical protein
MTTHTRRQRCCADAAASLADPAKETDVLAGLLAFSQILLRTREMVD